MLVHRVCGSLVGLSRKPLGNLMVVKESAE